MREISLKGFSRRYLIQLSHGHNLKINEMLVEVGTCNIRLYAPLLIWCYLTDKIVTKESRIYGELLILRKLYPEPKEEDLIEYCQESRNRELNKFIKSFIAYNRRKDTNELKDGYRDCIKRFQSELGLSAYQISKLTDIQTSNFYSWYNKNDNRKISLKKCDALLQVLCEMAGVK